MQEAAAGALSSLSVIALVGGLAFVKLRALGVLDLPKLSRPSGPERGTFVKYLFWTYERRDLTQNGDGSAPGYFGVVPVDVIALNYDEAERKARAFRPPTTDSFGYELKAITEVREP